MVSLTLIGPDRSQTSQLVHEDTEVKFSVQSPYLVSAGQTVDLAIMVRPCSWPKPRQLRDMSHLLRDAIPTSWDLCYLPSSRTLAEVLQDVVDHTAVEPTHGPNCVCMDAYAREIRLHIHKVLPPYESWEARMKADHRIACVLGMVMRSL